MKDRIYESGCTCPEVPCQYHPTPNRPFDVLAEGVAEDFHKAAETERGKGKK